MRRKVFSKATVYVLSTVMSLTSVASPMTSVFAETSVSANEQDEDKKSEKLGAVSSYDLSNVDVTDTYMSHAENIDIENMLKLDTDRLLAGFRETAGLDTLGKKRYGGNWENSLIGGHTLGHYMTALAQASAILPEGEKKTEVDKRLAYIIDTLEKCQNASRGKAGYIFGAELLGKSDVEFQFDNVEKGLANIATQAWVPWYTMHKILTGLVDTYKLTGNEKALTVAENLGRWVYNRANGWSSATQAKVLGIEYGGMNDCLYELYAVSNAVDKEKFAIAAHKFDEEKLFENVALGTANILNNKHANTTVVKFLGALNRYVTLDGKKIGDSVVDAKAYLGYAEAYFDMVLEKHSYVTGNSSEWEHFGMDNVLDAERTRSNCETCNAYNMLKLAKALFQITGDPKYSDYYEKTFYNSIMTAQDPETGLTTYWQPMATGYFKVYSSLDNHFWCCTGTGMEDFTKIGNAIYYNQGDTILVSEYISSVLKDNERNTIIEQISDIPNKDTVKITINAINADKAVVDTLALRLPEWLASDAAILVNGKEADYVKKAEYAFVSGLKAGDVVEMTLPMKVKAYNLPDGESEYAFMYGPVVLAAKLGKQSMSTATDGVNVLVPASKLISSDYISDGSETVSVINGTVDEFISNINKNLVKTDGKLEWTLENTDANLQFVPFYSLHGERYGLYFNYVSNTGAFNSMKYIKTKAADRDLDATYDTVQPGYGQYENDELHNMTDNGSTGFTDNGTGRSANADGSFTYRMKFTEGRDAYLQTYLLASDNGKTLKVSVGNTVVYEGTLNYAGEEELYMLRIPVSKEVLDSALYTISVTGGETKVADVKIASGKAGEASASVCNFMYSMRAYNTDTSLELSAKNATVKVSGNVFTVEVPSNLKSIDLASVLATPYGYEMIDGAIVRENIPFTVDLSRNNYIELEYVVYAEDHNTKESYTVNIAKKNDIKERKDTDKTVAYFVNCGDYDTTTLSEGDLFGVFNGVTEQAYGKDPVTGYKWGVVDTISNPLKNGTAANIPDGVYTDNTWPFETDKTLSDTSSKISTNRYTKNQFENGLDRNLNYSFEIPNDTYTVELYFVDPWTCSKVPNVAAEGKEIIKAAPMNKAVTGNVTVSDGKLDLNITAPSSTLAINLAYIKISSTHVTKETVEGTCTSDEQIKQTSKFGDMVFTSIISNDKSSGHLYDVTYQWSADKKTCKAVFKCKKCGEIKKQTCRVSAKVTKAATYKKKGTTTYTAATTVDGKKYTSVKSVNNIAVKKLSKPVISSVSNTSKGMTVAWKKVNGATGYVLECKTGSGKWVKVKTINSASTLKYTDKKANKNGTKYQYRVYAFAGNVKTNKSTVSASKMQYYLSAVTELNVNNIAAKKISATWKENIKASGYEIKYVTGKTAKTVKCTKSTILQKTINGLKKSSTYKVYIRAYNKYGSYSAWSKGISVKITK